ncbi:MAG: FGGY-family carbohydrate kinase [Pseudomonadota bacterium]
MFAELGYPTSQFLASDGVSRSRLWMQIVADIIQEPVQLLTGRPGSSLGAAWMAAMGADLTGDWAGANAFIAKGERVLPNPSHAVLYRDGYERFRQTYLAMSTHGPAGRS